MSTTIVSFLLSMKRLSTSRRGPIELVRDTDKITVNEAIPYITGGNQGIDEIKNIYQKTIYQFFVFLVNQDKNMVLNQIKNKLKYFVDKENNLC
ncbi:MAG TPA: hypothetical protein EYG10_05605 [Gammaproteobacteria bacterium]|jgi:hypothetical protein|nr:hypothetical protein [Gammaproteobacteria bacterium]